MLPASAAAAPYAIIRSTMHFTDMSSDRFHPCYIVSSLSAYADITKLALMMFMTAFSTDFHTGYKQSQTFVPDY